MGSVGYPLIAIAVNELIYFLILILDLNAHLLNQGGFEAAAVDGGGAGRKISDNGFCNLWYGWPACISLQHGDLIF